MRKGPVQRSVLSCVGCAFAVQIAHRSILDIDVFACNHPEVIEGRTNVQALPPQLIPTPEFCPYVEEGKRAEVDPGEVGDDAP